MAKRELRELDRWKRVAHAWRAVVQRKQRRRLCPTMRQAGDLRRGVARCDACREPAQRIIAASVETDTGEP